MAASNRSTSFCALVVEVAHDREAAVGLEVPPEPLVEVGLAAVGRHRQLARERQAIEPETSIERDLRWFQAMAIGPVAAGAAIGAT